MSTSKKQLPDFSGDAIFAVRRSPRISGHDLNLRSSNSNQDSHPSHPVKNKLLLAIKESVNSCKTSRQIRHSEFSDEDTEDETIIAVKTLPPKLPISKQLHQKVTSLIRRMNRFNFETQMRFRYARLNHTHFGLICVIALLLAVLPFMAPYLQTVLSGFTQHSRTLVMSIPDMFRKDSFESLNSLEDEKMRIPIQEIVEKLISHPGFLQSVKSSGGSSVTRFDQISQKFDNLLESVRSESERKNGRLSSEVATLRSEIESKLTEVSSQLPRFSENIESMSMSFANAMSNMELRFADLDLDFEATKLEVRKLKHDRSGESQKLLNTLSEFEARLLSLGNEFSALKSAVASCSERNLASEVIVIAEEVFKAKNKTLQQQFSEISSKFATTDELQEQIHSWNQHLKMEFEMEVQSIIDSHIKQDFSAKIEDFEKLVQQKVSQDASSMSTFSKDDVFNIVQKALTTYDADKTGLFDFALESAGGTIATTRCTETYDVANAVYSVFGIPLWWVKNNPRTILQPGSSPGQCWAFKGSHGGVVINLSTKVFIKAVTLEHIPPSLTVDGSISSAPKNFEVYALASLNDGNPVKLGNFTYSDQSSPVQTFYLTDPPGVSFNMVELKILSNHGNMVYTCVYRFRIHGSSDREQA